MQKQQAQCRPHAEESCRDRRDHEAEAQQAHRRSQILTRQGIARDTRKGYHDDCDGGDDTRLHRRLAHDQRPDDGNRVADGVWQVQPRLLQKLKGQEHPDDLQRGGKRHLLLGLDHAQQQPRRDHLLVIEGDSHVQRRQQQTQKKGQPAQKGQGAGDERIRGAVRRDPHKVGEAHRPQKADGQTVHQQPHAPFRQILREAVRPLGVQKLRKGGLGRVAETVLQKPRRQQGVRIQRVKTAGELLRNLRGHRTLKVQHRDTRARRAPHRGFHQLQPRGAEPAAHQRGVHTQGLDKGVLRAFDGFFQRRFCHRALGFAAGLKAHSLASALKQQHTAAVRQILHGLVGGLPVSGRAVVYRACENAQQALPGAFTLGQA